LLEGYEERRGERRGRKEGTRRNANEWSASGGLKRHPKQGYGLVGEYVVYATMLIKYHEQINQKTPDTKIMRVVIHGIAKECG